MAVVGFRHTEQRRDLRRDVQCVSLIAEGKQFNVSNVSVGGCLLTAQGNNLKVGGEYTVQAFICSKNQQKKCDCRYDSSKGTKPVVIPLNAKLRAVRNDESGGTGCHFVRLTGTQFKKIEHVVACGVAKRSSQPTRKSFLQGLLHSFT